jgi:hypothetical protein
MTSSGSGIPYPTGSGEASLRGRNAPSVTSCTGGPVRWSDLTRGGHLLSRSESLAHRTGEAVLGAEIPGVAFSPWAPSVTAPSSIPR